MHHGLRVDAKGRTMMGVGRAMGRSFASSTHGARRALASGRTSQGEEEEEEEEEGEEETGTGPHGMHLEGGPNAYQVLGVSPSCSHHSIREAFTKLAKLTHPDLQPGPSTSAHFILISSAYQILSSPAKRARYDAYLQECANSREKNCNFEMKTKAGFVNRDMEVVEWLRWYRNMAMTMVHQQEIGTRGGLCDEFRANLQEAFKRAYFGPDLGNDDDALPDCFEAEERAEATELEVLQLVSGRKLIGAVLQVGPVGLVEGGVSKLVPFANFQCSQGSSSSFKKDVHILCVSQMQESQEQARTQASSTEDHDQSAFVDLELYLYGNLVARATRAQPNSAVSGCVSDDNSLDEITVHLCHDMLSKHESGKVKEDMFLGTIVGLNTTESGGKGRVYSSSGEHTHIIWQFRTPWVKHLHWFKVDAKRMLCECRSTRACLPNSKFWLFEPRCGRHDIGGWYIETLWRNGSTEAGTSTDWVGKHLGLLHPAMYILGTAYKTLDTEVIKRKNKPLWSMLGDRQAIIAAAALGVLRWCKSKLLTLKH